MSAICAILPLADQRRTTALVRLRGTSEMAGPNERARALWKAPERAEPHAGQAFSDRPTLSALFDQKPDNRQRGDAIMGFLSRGHGEKRRAGANNLEAAAPARTFTNDAGAYLWIEKAEPGQPLSKPGLAAHVWGCARAVLSSRHCEQAVAFRQSQRSMSGGLSLYAASGRPQAPPLVAGFPYRVSAEPVTPNDETARG